jgi:hypothetical protein
MSAKKFVLWILFLCFPITYAGWVYFGHEQRSISRLLNTGIIRDGANVELLYSSGFTRDNWHIFKVSRDGVRLENAYLRDPKDEFDAQEMGPVIEGINRHTIFDVNQKNAEFYDISQPAGHLVFLTVVKREKGDILVLMRVM